MQDKAHSPGKVSLLEGHQVIYFTLFISTWVLSLREPVCGTDSPRSSVSGSTAININQHLGLPACTLPEPEVIIPDNKIKDTRSMIFCWSVFLEKATSTLIFSWITWEFYFCLCDGNPWSSQRRTDTLKQRDKVTLTHCDKTLCTISSVWVSSFKI